ncbi:uncharacterized protein LOC113217044 [Frankliniella occidentalis]|uniref:Uncharacterized protein LOC113217044 n=1 Tax=Frankliniella occidentalis TaxID=133901 RepID=A0A6J1TM04_FRAOC|nr:uncharacterized protein LOC113217044 [Frankliniella occidentalis]
MLSPSAGQAASSDISSSTSSVRKALDMGETSTPGLSLFAELTEQVHESVTNDEVLEEIENNEPLVLEEINNNEPPVLEEISNNEPLVKERLKTVVITDISFDVKPDKLSDFLSQAAWDFDILLKPEKAVIDLFWIDDNEMMQGFKVEFLSTFVATRMSDLKELLFEDNYLPFLQEQTVFRKPVVYLVPSSFEIVKNLPTKFFLPAHFIDHLNTTAWLQDLGPAEDESVVTQLIKEDNSSSGRIQFIDAEVAKKMCAQTITYDHHKIEMVQEMEQASSLSPMVTISNLPQNFYEAHFCNFMKDLGELGLKDPVNSLLSVTKYSESERSCVAKFTTPEIAAKVCEMPEKYDRCELKMVQHVVPSDAPAVTESVRVSNLPKSFYQAHFENF